MEAEYVLFRLQIEAALMREHFLVIGQIRNIQQDYLIFANIIIEAFQIREKLLLERNRLQEESMLRSVLNVAATIRQQLLRTQNEHARNTEGEELMMRSVSNEADAIRRHFLTNQHARNTERDGCINRSVNMEAVDIRRHLLQNESARREVRPPAKFN